MTNANVILDDVSKTTITPTEILDSADRINADFLDFEEVRSTEIEYEGLTGGTLAANDTLRSIQVTYGNPVTDSINRWKDAGRMIEFNRQEIIDFANAEISVHHPGFYYPGDNATDQWSRFSDAYRLITKNKEYIIEKSYVDMVAQYPSLTVPSEPQVEEILASLSKHFRWTCSKVAQFTLVSCCKSISALTELPSSTSTAKSKQLSMPLNRHLVT